MYSSSHAAVGGEKLSHLRVSSSCHGWEAHSKAQLQCWLSAARLDPAKLHLLYHFSSLFFNNLALPFARLALFIHLSFRLLNELCAGTPEGTTRHAGIPTQRDNPTILYIYIVFKRVELLQLTDLCIECPYNFLQCTFLLGIRFAPSSWFSIILTRLSKSKWINNHNRDIFVC